MTPQALLASAVRDNQHRTLLRRISSGGVDLGRFAAVLDVSRAAAAGQLDLAATRAALERAAEQPRAYGVALTTLVVGMACACFIVLFGGGLWETVAVFLATTCTHLLRRWLHVLGLSRLLTTLLLASVGSALSLLILRLLLAAQLPLVAPGLAVVGVAVLLIPGVLLVSSIVDLFRGHIMAGWTRVVAALLEIAMIGAGVWLTLLLTGSNLDLSLGTPQISLVVALLAGLAAGGFAILFDVPQRALVAIVLIGAVGYSTRLMLLQFGLPLEVGSLVAGGFVGLAAEVLARRLRLPTSVFTIPAFIPLVPGVTAFRAVLAFADQRYLDGLGELIRALLIVTAIAIGIGAVTEIVRVRRAA